MSLVFIFKAKTNRYSHIIITLTDTVPSSLKCFFFFILMLSSFHFQQWFKMILQNKAQKHIHTHTYICSSLNIIFMTSNVFVAICEPATIRLVSIVQQIHLIRYKCSHWYKHTTHKNARIWNDEDDGVFCFFEEEEEEWNARKRKRKKEKNTDFTF